MGEAKIEIRNRGTAYLSPLSSRPRLGSIDIAPHATPKIKIPGPACTAPGIKLLAMAEARYSAQFNPTVTRSVVNSCGPSGVAGKPLPFEP